MLNTTKQCSKCKTIKNLLEFSKRKASKDGYNFWCKKCMKQYHKENFSKTRDKKISYNRLYRQENKEKVLQYGREYCSKNKESKREYHRLYTLKHKDRITEYSHKYKRDNKEKIKEYSKHYSQRESSKLSKINASSKRRDMKLRTSDSTIPIHKIYPLTKELQQLLEKQNYKCNNCGCDITKDKHLDHHIPLSKGGKHSIDNVVWLCPSCNLSKSNKMPKELLLI